jgi:sphingomyelin phosphodiesterase acid-like 3
MFRLKMSLAMRTLATVALIALSIVPALAASPQKATTPAATVPALLLSDIHFDPFRDPAKVSTLAAAPVSGWRSILDSPASPDRETGLAALEKSCPTRGEDTDEALFVSSLRAIAVQARGSRFVTVAGDLMAHSFDCKFRALFPRASGADYSSFSVKTMDFVLAQLRAALPGVPVYAALGNNDSGCGDYQLDPRSQFLAQAANSFTADVPAPEQEQARADFAALGDYSAALPAPFKHTRILALDDLFESRRYTGCSGKPNPAPAVEQIAWLRRRLDAARAAGDKVWIVGHIPPGIDPFSTATHRVNVCAGQQPQIFLSSSALPDAIAPYGDVVRLVLFAHTHMDEMRMLAPSTPGNAPVAIKLTPSISPIDGNLPSFTLAHVDAATATLADYSVVASSDMAGSAWATEYDFAKAYGKSSYTAATVTQLIAGFRADPTARTPASQTYIRNYFVRDASLAIQAYWPQYSCALANYTAEGYRSCLCAPRQ